MVLDKVQHYLSYIFVLALIVAQASIFVVTRAAISNSNQLNAVFIEPSLSRDISVGEAINIQAMLALPDNHQADSVYFSISGQNRQLNFEANVQDDGSWLASSAWDTLSWSAGQYTLGATAKVYDQGLISQSYSIDNYSINLIVGNQAAIGSAIGTLNNKGSITSPTPNQIIRDRNTLDIVYGTPANILGMTYDLLYRNPSTALLEEVLSAVPMQQYTGVTEEYRNELNLSGLEYGEYVLNFTGRRAGNDTADGIGTNANPVAGDIVAMLSVNFFYEAALNTGEEADLSNLVSIISPSGRTSIVNDAIEVSIRIEEPILGNLKARIDSAVSTDTYEIPLAGDVASVLTGSPTTSIPPGSYRVVAYMITNEGLPEEVSVDLTSVTVTVVLALNQNDGDLSITDVSPTANEVITTNSIEIRFNTSLAANNSTVEIYNSEQAAISDQIIMDFSDGQSWAKNYILSETFVDGVYTVEITVKYSNTDGLSVVPKKTATKSYSVTLARDGVVSNPDDPDINPDYNNVRIEIADLEEQTLSGSATIDIYTNYDDLDVIFNLFDSTGQSVSNFSGSNIISRSNLLDNSGMRYMSTGRFNTSLYENGNYKLMARLLNGSELLATSTEAIISIFNDGVYDGAKIRLYSRYMPEENAVTLYVSSNINLGERNLGILNEDGNYIASVVAIDIDRQIIDELAINISEGDIYNNHFMVNFEVTYLNEGDRSLSIAILDNLGQVVEASNAIKVVIRDNQAIYDSDGTNDASDLSDDEEVVEENVRLDASEDLSVDQLTTCIEVFIEDELRCKQFHATIGNNIVNECLEQNIFDAVSCEDYLNRLTVDQECQANNIVNREECKDYLIEKYSSNVDCALDNVQSCRDILRNQYLNRLIVEQQHQESVRRVIDLYIGQVVSTRKLSDEFSREGLDRQTLPLEPQVDIQVLVAPSQEEFILEDEDTLTVISKAILVIDSDGDGLLDDLEAYYGTDINNRDSDGDGFEDATEISNGYNPAGPGKLTIERTDFDKALLAKAAIEQPKNNSEKIDREYKIESVVNNEDDIILIGRATPDTWVNIYLYSDLPLVMTTKTDSSGNWSYTISKSLTDGHHRAYVTINDDTGRIVKQSSPLSFLVRNAKAVAADDYFDETITQDKTTNFVWYYVLAAALLVILSLIIVFIIHRNRSQGLEV